MGINPRRRMMTETMHGNPRRRSRPALPGRRALDLDVALIPRKPQPYMTYCNHHDDPCADSKEHKRRKDEASARGTSPEELARQARAQAERDKALRETAGRYVLTPEGEDS